MRSRHPDSHIVSRRRFLITEGARIAREQGHDPATAYRRAELIQEIADLAQDRLLILTRALTEAGAAPSTWVEIIGGRMPEAEIVALRDRVRALPRVGLDEITEWALRG